MTTLKHQTDPHLAALRIAAENLRSPAGQNLQRARFSLFAAIEQEDVEQARAWLSAVEVAVRTLPDKDVMRLLLGSVEAIRAALDAEEAPLVKLVPLP